MQRRQDLVVPLELVKLTALMERTSGSPEVKIGLIDGPVVTQHPDLAGEHLREIPGNNGATCTQANSTACLHGTFVAGILILLFYFVTPPMGLIELRSVSGRRSHARSVVVGVVLR